MSINFIALLVAIVLVRLVQLWVQCKTAKQDDDKFTKQAKYIEELEAKIKTLEESK